MESGSFTRAGLLGVGARCGAAVLAAGSAFGALAQTASAAPLSDNDLAFARLLVGAELLAMDFYKNVLDADKLSHVGAKYARRVLADESAHYDSVAGILTGA